MRKTFKKIVASIMAVSTLAVGAAGMSASAYSNSVNFHRVPGTPSSDTCTSAT